MRLLINRLLQHQGGGAAVEFGLIAPVLIAVVLGLGQVGGSVHARHAMRKASAAGAEALMTTGASASAIQTVVLEAWTNRPSDGAVEIDQYCTCAAVRQACTNICDNGEYPQSFTKITLRQSLVGPTGTENLVASQLVRTR